MHTPLTPINKPTQCEGMCIQSLHYRGFHGKVKVLLIWFYLRYNSDNKNEYKKMEYSFAHGSSFSINYKHSYLYKNFIFK